MIKKGKKRVRGKRASAYRRNTRRKRGNSMPSKHSLSWYSDSHIPEIAGQKDPLEKEAEKTSSKASGLSPSVQMKSDGISKNSVSSTFAKTLNQTKNSGSPLPEKTQKSMSSKMGSSFKDVRIHKGKEADSMSKEINAKAFTYGRDIYFKEGHFQPDSKEGQKLIAHELVHTRQQSSKIHRAPIVHGSTLGGWSFTVGDDLPKSFFNKAKKLSADGPLTSDEINQLRMHSIINRGTVTHAERLLMAALLDINAIRIVQGTQNNTFNIPLNLITRDQRRAVRASGQSDIPEEIQILMAQNLWQSLNGDQEKIAQSMIDLNNSTTKAILKEAATFKRKAAKVISFAKANNIFLPDVLRAMVNGASDNSNGDKYMAGLVYTVLAANGHAEASEILSGRLKVDALSDSAFSKKSKASGLYNSRGHTDTAKGDTLYLRTSLDINNVSDRSLIIHEFTHFLQDLNKPPGNYPDIDLELEAYQAQAQYVMDQIIAENGANNKARMIKEVRGQLNLTFLQWAYILAANTNPPLYTSTATDILIQIPGHSQQTVNHLVSQSRADLVREMLKSFITSGKYNAGDSTNLDSIAGPSLLDHFN